MLISEFSFQWGDVLRFCKICFLYFSPHPTQDLWRPICGIGHTPGLGAHSSANALAKLLWAYFSPSAIFCCSIISETYNPWWENSFWGNKAHKNMKKWLKKSKKCLKMAKNHAQKKKTVIINTEFRVNNAQNKRSYCVRLKISCLISIGRHLALRDTFILP